MVSIYLTPDPPESEDPTDTVDILRLSSPFASPSLHFTDEYILSMCRKKKEMMKKKKKKKNSIACLAGCAPRPKPL